MKTLFQLNNLLQNKLSTTRCQQEFDRFLTKDIKGKQKALLGEALKKQLMFPTVIMSHEKFAKNVKCSRKHAVITTNELHQIGLLYKTKQFGFNKPCLYRFPPEIFKFNFRQILNKHFPFLKWIPMVLLTSLQSSEDFKKVTLMKRVIYITSSHTLNNREKGVITLQSDDKYSPHQEAKKLLNLNVVGQAQLLLFTEEAVAFAVEDYKKAKRVRVRIYKPFSYFFNIAKKFSLENKLKLDWGKYYEWKEKLNWEYLTPCCENEKTSTSSTTNRKMSNDDNVVPTKNLSTNSKFNAVPQPVLDDQRLIMYTRLSNEPGVNKNLFKNNNSFYVDNKFETISNDITVKKELIKLYSQMTPLDARYQFAYTILVGLKKSLLLLEEELSKINNPEIK